MRIFLRNIFLCASLACLMSGAAWAAVPEISRVSPIEARAVFQVFGENLAGAEVYLWQPAPAEGLPELKAAALPKAPPKEVRPIKPVMQQGQVLYAVNDRLRGTAVLWLKNADGFSAPRLVNRPEVWSRSSDEAMAGERFQVFGQNMRTRYAGRPWCVLRSRGDGKVYQAVWGPVQTQDMPYQDEYKMELMLPRDVPAGEYELLVHAGAGGAYGWSEPVGLKIVEKRDLIGLFNMAWNRLNLEVDSQTMSETPDTASASSSEQQVTLGQVLSGLLGLGTTQPKSSTASPAGMRVIRLDAALGDGIKDAGPAIQKAIDDLAAVGGGIVSLPAGAFGITKTLHLKPGVVIKGSGMGASTITVPFGARLAAWWPPTKADARSGGRKGWAVDWEQPLKAMPNTPLIWIETLAGLQDLKLMGGPGAGHMVLVATADGRRAEKVFFNSVAIDNPDRRHLAQNGTFQPGMGGIVVMNSTYAFTLWNCSLKAPDPLEVLPSRHSFMRLIGNHFESSPRQTSNVVVIKGVFDSMIVENTFANGRRSLVAQQGFSRNWVFQNRSIDVARGANGHEEYMCEGGSADWTGKPAQVRAASAVITDKGFDLSAAGDAIKDYEMYLYIMAGRGLGQYRRVRELKGNELLLDAPWDILPDTNTEMAFIRFTNKNLWVNNSGGPGSGIGQFIYGSGVENIIAGHQSISNGQLSLYAAAPAEGKDYGALAFNQVIGCESRFSGGHNAVLVLWSRAGASQYYTGRPYTILGNIVRHNTLAGNIEAAQMKNQTAGGYWQTKAGDRMNFDPEKTCGIELNGGFNLVDNNFILGLPVGVRVVGSGEGNLIYNNRIDGAKTSVLDETGQSTVTAPARQDYKAVVPAG